MLLVHRRVELESDRVKTARIIHSAQHSAQRTCTRFASFPTLADPHALVGALTIQHPVTMDRHTPVGPGRTPRGTLGPVRGEAVGGSTHLTEHVTKCTCTTWQWSVTRLTGVTTGQPKNWRATNPRTAGRRPRRPSLPKRWYRVGSTWRTGERVRRPLAVETRRQDSSDTRGCERAGRTSRTKPAQTVRPKGLRNVSQV